MYFYAILRHFTQFLRNFYAIFTQFLRNITPLVLVVQLPFNFSPFFISGHPRRVSRPPGPVGVHRTQRREVQSQRQDAPGEPGVAGRVAGLQTDRLRQEQRGQTSFIKSGCVHQCSEHRDASQTSAHLVVGLNPA